MHLHPTPAELRADGASFSWPEAVTFAGEETLPSGLAGSWERFLATARQLSRRPWRAAEKRESALFRVAADESLPAQGYRLELHPAGLELSAGTAAGFRHGLATLRQLLAQTAETGWPHVSIEDAPAIETRGYLLDLSRDRVPTQATLFRLVETLAALKFNQLQLYTEHTFAYAGREEVWGLASPLTPDEVRSLDAHCADHGLELVPCLNTFGHWERWLQHPRYFAFAECPYGWRRPDGHGMPWGSTLQPGADSLALLEGLLGEYLPLFRSRRVNIGGDEPWELGTGRSRDRCEREGRAAVYREFLLDVVAAAHRHKEIVQFWGDIVLESPASWDPPAGRTELLVWGYEAGHPFAAQAGALAERGQAAVLCPGTSTWNSLGGRLDNALENIREAAAAAVASGTRQLLLTDWGDHGHHHPPVLSHPALHAFAQAAWNPAADPPDLAAAMGSALAGGPPPELGRSLLQLGRLGRLFRFQPANRLPLVQVLTTPQDQLGNLLEPLLDEELLDAKALLEPIRGTLAEFRPPSPAVARQHREITLVLDLLLHAIDRADACRRPGARDPNELGRVMTALIGRFETLWIEAHRVGGLHESSGRLRRALATYPTAPARRPAWPPEPPPAA